MDVLTVQTIISEVGLDPSKFKTVKHFCSSFGLCPGCRITGGKVKSSQTRKVKNRAANAKGLAAQAVSRSQTALGANYRRIKARSGAPKAITATAHKIACSAVRLRGPCPSATLRLPFGSAQGKRSGQALRGREVEGH